jgi:hypothetical protein
MYTYVLTYPYYLHMYLFSEELKRGTKNIGTNPRTCPRGVV